MIKGLDTLDKILSILNDGKKLPSPEYIENWKESSNRVTFHSKGIKPPYKILRNGHESIVSPPNWDPKYKYIVENYIFNRHPQENEWSYQFRLGAYTCITQQIVLQGINQLQGSIFQKSNYSISINDQKSLKYIQDRNFNGDSFESFLKNDIFTAMINDPNGFIAVLEGHNNYFDSGENAKPYLSIIDSSDVVSFQENEFLFAKKGGLFLLLTEDLQCYLHGEKKGRDFVYSVKEETIVFHKFGKLPAIQFGGNKISIGDKYYYQSFFQPFVNWADLTVRNLSDHEVIIKNFSYPHKQVVLPKCNDCNGFGTIQKECDTGICEHSCTTCDGKGTISINPGEIYIQEAPLPNQEFKQYDSVKFINPDVQILVQSNEHWKQYYDEAQKSLYIDVKGQGANQSAESKEYDRQKFYVFCQNISQRLFYVSKYLLKYIAAYLNTTTINGELMYDTNIEIEIKEPQIFSTKNELDLINEYKLLSENGSDRSLKVKAEIELAEKLYGANSIDVKKIDILSNLNPLYGYTIDELVKLSALGVVTERLVNINTYSLMLLNNLILRKGSEFVINTDTFTIVELLNNEIDLIIDRNKQSNTITF